MKNLLYKELKLVSHPMVFIFSLFGIMLLIPSYPYLIPFIYCFVSFTFIFIGGRESKDMFFTTCLPIERKSVVTSRFISIMIIELFTVAFAVPFAFLSHIINKNGNDMLDANMALFGFVLLMYGIFNYIFLTIFYKTAYKLAKPFLYGSIVVLIYGVAIEVLIQAVPVLKENLDGFSGILPQAIVLCIGIVGYALLNIFALKKSQKEFLLIDL